MWAKASGLPLAVMTKAANDDYSLAVPITPAVVASEQQVADAFTASGLIPVHLNFSGLRRHLVQRHGQCLMTRQLHFNAFLMGCGHHEAAWRLPESDPFANLDLGHWTNLAQTCERGGFDSVLLADSPALWGNAKHRPGGALEPTVLLTALAGVTSRIGLIATASTTYNDPFNLARRFAARPAVSAGSDR